MPTDDDFDEDRPARRPRNSRDDDEDRPARRRRDDDDYDDGPRRGGKPHRGGMILTFGILGLLCCGIFAILAAIMGSQDLKEMQAGRMDRSGEGLTRVGMILGFVGIGLWVIGIIARVVLMATNH
jgi:hypothetical protein